MKRFLLFLWLSPILGGCASPTSEVSYQQYREWSTSSLCQLESLVRKGDRNYFVRKTYQSSGKGFHEKVFWYTEE